MNCPKCGGTVAYAGVSTVECCTSGCDNFGGTITSQPPPKMRRTWKEYFEELLKKKVGAKPKQLGVIIGKKK